MKFTVWSDLHSEMNGRNLKLRDVAAGDVLILAGDILSAAHLHPNTLVDLCSEQASDFLSEIFPKFRHVVYVFGNHEFYRSVISEARDAMRLWFRERGATNLTILENDWLDVGGAIIYGCTLWTDLSNILKRILLEKHLNDYQLIRMFHSDDVPDLPASRRLTHNEQGIITGTYTHQLHLESVGKLKAFLELRKQRPDIRNKPLVVVTHHAPSFRSVNPNYSHNGLDPGFASDLDDFIRAHPEIKVWVHGHTHKSFDYQIGETRIFANQHGYHHEPIAKAFDINAGFHI